MTRKKAPRNEELEAAIAGMRETSAASDSHYSRRFATASQGVPLQKPESKQEPKSTKQQPVSVPDTMPHMRPLQVPTEEQQSAKDNVYPGNQNALLKVTRYSELDAYVQVAGNVFYLSTEGKELVIENRMAQDHGRGMIITPTSSTRIKLS